MIYIFKGNIKAIPSEPRHLKLFIAYISVIGIIICAASYNILHHDNLLDDSVINTRVII